MQRLGPSPSRLPRLAACEARLREPRSLGFLVWCGGGKCQIPSNSQRTIRFFRQNHDGMVKSALLTPGEIHVVADFEVEIIETSFGLRKIGEKPGEIPILCIFCSLTPQFLMVKSPGAGKSTISPVVSGSADAEDLLCDLQKWQRRSSPRPWVH